MDLDVLLTKVDYLSAQLGNNLLSLSIFQYFELPISVFIAIISLRYISKRHKLNFAFNYLMAKGTKEMTIEKVLSITYDSSMHTKVRM